LHRPRELQQGTMNAIRGLVARRHGPMVRERGPGNSQRCNRTSQPGNMSEPHWKAVEETSSLRSRRRTPTAQLPTLGRRIPVHHLSNAVTFPPCQNPPSASSMTVTPPRFTRRIASTPTRSTNRGGSYSGLLSRLARPRRPSPPDRRHRPHPRHRPPPRYRPFRRSRRWCRSGPPYLPNPRRPPRSSSHSISPKKLRHPLYPRHPRHRLQPPSRPPLLPPRPPRCPRCPLRPPRPAQTRPRGSKRLRARSLAFRVT
jgi:hypothetical protein